jgi:peptidoglycan/xylan/chitin deacetylase (PgdA/CDA1 family)
MENRRYDYLPIVGRKVIKWPGDARVALLVCPNIEYFHIDKTLPVSASPHVPDVPEYALRDLGARIGVFRMMDVLDKHGIRASVLLNSEVCEYHPKIIEEGKKRGWEWLGHGVTNNLRMTNYPLEEELKIIRQVKETITSAVGTAPKGWLGPGGGVETFNTPDHLAAEGFEYLCDWGCDEQPIPMRVRSGRMITMPYQQGVNDIRVMYYAKHTPEEYLRMVCDQFDVLYGDGAQSGRVMTLPLHPFVIGLPFRIKYLDKALEYICSHERVWRATGWEVANWYYEHYYEDPGQLE